MQIEKMSSAEDLNFTFKVTVSGPLVFEKVQEWLTKRSSTISLPGFRKGKVPLKTVEAMYLGKAIENSLEHFIDESYKDVLKSNGINPASKPKFKVVDPYDHSKKSDFSFEIQVLSFPDVILKDFSSITLEKLEVIFDDSEIDESISKIANDKKFLVEMPEDHVISTGDVVKMSIKTTLNKKIIKEFSIKEITLPFVEKKDTQESKDVFAFVDSILKACVGQKKDAVILTSHSFPDSFKDKNWASKTVDIEIKIIKIEQEKKLEDHEEIAKNSGFKTLDDMKNRIRDDIKKHYASIARIYHKRKLLDAMANEYTLAVPKELVDHEFENIWNKLQEEIKETGYDEGTTEEDARKEYYAIADRRVRLGLVISQYSKDNKIHVTDDMVKMVIANEINKEPWNKEKIIEYYQKNPAAIDFIRASLLEDIIVNEILEKVTSVKIDVSIKELKDLMKDILPGFEGEEESNDAKNTIEQSENIGSDKVKVEQTTNV